MARINTRPDIIYVKDLTEQDKENFEKILKMLRTTNNGEAVKLLFSKYLEQQEKLLQQQNEILKLQENLEDAKKEKLKFFSNTEKLLVSLSSVEENVKSAKKELSKLK